MNIKMLTPTDPDYPPRLFDLGEGKPDPLYHLGADLNTLLERPALAIVGSRRMTMYGRQVTNKFAAELAEQGIVIVSGLAYGVDAAAMQAALDAGGYVIGVLPGPLDNILPVYNRKLAQQILDTGGALVSEYAPAEIPIKTNFIERNRIVSGLAKSILVTEATASSGTRHTVRFAIAQSRDVLAIPGNITSPASEGTNNYIKQDKAKAVTSVTDVLFELGITPHKTHIRKAKGRNPEEQALLNALATGMTDGDQLLEKTGLSVELFNQTLTMLEIAGKIRPLGMNHWCLV